MPKLTPTPKAKIDQKEIKRIIAAVKNRKIASPLRGSDFSRPPVSKNQRAAAEMIESVVTKAGLDIGKINKLLAEDQKALRAVFDKQQAAAARHFPAADLAFRSGMAARLKALGLLATPFVSSFVILDKPFLISQLPNPQLDIFRDSHIESMNSSVKVLINVDRGSELTQFVFYYLWENESDSAVTTNVSSSLVMNGAFSVQAAPGFFSGDKATLEMAAFLTLMRWSGWGIDPVTGESNDQTPDPNVQPSEFQSVALLQARGGHIFEHADFHSQSFQFQPFPVFHRLFVVPGKAFVIFEVVLNLSYSFDGGGNIEDSVFVDFANNGNAVFCPNVELEILTPLPAVAVTVE